MISKARLALMVLSLVTGVPLTIAGLQLKEGMFLKQMVNCQEDASKSVMSLLDGDINNIRGSEFEGINANLKTCTKDIDPRIGVVKFLRNEHERNNNDSMVSK